VTLREPARRLRQRGWLIDYSGGDEHRQASRLTAAISTSGW
jgi:hypothetical protein